MFDLQPYLQKYAKVSLDIGTGDGRFVYKNALRHPNTLFIGIDPADIQFKDYARKIARKKLANALLLKGSIEDLPSELAKNVDEVYIIMPWGSLLAIIAKAQPLVLANLSKLLKPNGTITIVFGYDNLAEPSEFTRLDLPELTEEYIKTNIIPSFEKAGLSSTSNSPESVFGTLQMDTGAKGFYALDKENLKNFESTWAKKLRFGKDRKIFLLTFSV